MFCTDPPLFHLHLCVCVCVWGGGGSPVGHVQGVEEAPADEVSEEGLRLAACRSVSDDDRAAAMFQGETGSQLRMRIFKLSDPVC